MQRLENAMFTQAGKYISHLFQNQEEEIQILEPLTCMIRLAILSFKPKGTKICIYQNSIYIQDPGLFQGTLRWISGDNRNDLHFLKDPILKALVRYDPSKDENIKFIFTLAGEGLLKLKNSYSDRQSSSLTSHSIDYYIKIIQDTVNGSPPKTDDGLDVNIQQSFKELWEPDQIVLITNIFKQAQKQKDSKPYLEAVENLLSVIIKSSKEILVKNMRNL